MASPSKKIASPFLPILSLLRSQFLLLGSGSLGPCRSPCCERFAPSQIPPRPLWENWLVSHAARALGLSPICRSSALPHEALLALLVLADFAHNSLYVKAGTRPWQKLLFLPLTYQTAKKAFRSYVQIFLIVIGDFD